MSEIGTSLDFGYSTYVPFPDNPNFRHCPKSGHPDHPKCKRTQNTWLVLTIFMYKCFYGPEFPKQPSLVCSDFSQLGCLDFGRYHPTSTSEIWMLETSKFWHFSVLGCLDFGHSLYLERNPTFK